jgi:hypothetical protein
MIVLNEMYLQSVEHQGQLEAVSDTPSRTLATLQCTGIHPMACSACAAGTAVLSVRMRADRHRIL